MVALAVAVQVHRDKTAWVPWAWATLLEPVVAFAPIAVAREATAVVAQLLMAHHSPKRLSRLSVSPKTHGNPLSKPRQRRASNKTPTRLKLYRRRSRVCSTSLPLNASTASAPRFSSGQTSPRRRMTAAFCDKSLLSFSKRLRMKPRGVRCTRGCAERFVKEQLYQSSLCHVN